MKEFFEETFAHRILKSIGLLLEYMRAGLAATAAEECAHIGALEPAGAELVELSNMDHFVRQNLGEQIDAALPEATVDVDL